MSSLDLPDGPLSQEETVPIALLLAFVGGYLDVYTWIIHGVMANAQTANLVLLWVYGASGKWDDAFHFVPSIVAFATGIVLAAWLRKVAGRRTSNICAVVEIVLLVAVGVLHNRLPDLAGTLGISFVAAMQTAVFTKVDGVAYSSVMATGNLRQAIEGAFLAVSGGGPLRRSGIFAGLCISFGVGAAVGAFATKGMPDLALGLPALALVIVLLHSGFERREVPA
ncbi:YoaK family protein [Bradyrhizobium oligotrophicum S58]